MLKMHEVKSMEALGKVTTTEIMSQPEAWAKTIEWARKSKGEFPRIDFNEYDRIYTIGSGSSYYLSMVLESLIAKRSRVPSFAIPACEAFLTPDNYFGGGEKYLVFVTSRSGRSTEALIATDYLRSHFSANVITLGCYQDSPLSQKERRRLLATAGQEEGIVMTRSFSTMLLMFELFLSLNLGADTGWADALPSFGTSLMETYKGPIASVINNGDFNHFVFLGSGELYGIAREAALKMEEMAIVAAEAYHTLEYRHGPKSVAGKKTLVVVFLLPEQGEYQLSLLRDLKAFGTTIIAVGEEQVVAGLSKFADLAVALPRGVNEYQTLCLSLPIAHLLGLNQAIKRGQDPDRPRNLTQVVEL